MNNEQLIMKPVQRHCGLNPQSPANSAFNKGIAEQVRNDGLIFRNVLTTILFLLMVSFAFGQSKDIEEPQKWSKENFIENGISIVFVYSYEFDENGNIKDSLLIYRNQFDVQGNKVFGINHGELFEKYYNDNGQIIKEKANEDGFFIETDYEYDSSNKVIKITDKEFYNRYFKNKPDTLIEINEYLYNSDGHRIAWIHSKERATYFKRKKTTVIDSFDPKWLVAQCKYDYDSLSSVTEWIIFNRDSLIVSKKIYFYDDQNRLILQNDSTRETQVYGYLRPEHCCERTITYEYTDTGKIETQTRYGIRGEVYSKVISHYNNDDRVAKLCRYYFSNEACEEYFYFYENDKLTKLITNTVFGYAYTTTYSYNEKGLLTEEQELENDKITKLIRYYYE